MDRDQVDFILRIFNKIQLIPDFLKIQQNKNDRYFLTLIISVLTLALPASCGEVLQESSLRLGTETKGHTVAIPGGGISQIIRQEKPTRDKKF